MFTFTFYDTYFLFYIVFKIVFCLFRSNKKKHG